MSVTSESPMQTRLRAWIRIWRVPLAFIVVAYLLARDFAQGVVPHRALGVFYPPHDPWGTIGCIVALKGAGIRAWASGILHKAESVTSVGPYALVRHPLYLGSLLIALGLCIVLGDPVNVVAVLLYAVLVYVPKARDEEFEMRSKFGAAYDEYASRVPAIIPMGFPAAALAPWDAARFRHHREWRTVLATVIALVILELLASGVLSLPR